MYTVCLLILGQLPPSPGVTAPQSVPTAAPLVTTHQFLLQHDTNRDGFLEESEIPEPLKRRFARTDADLNGKIDARELLMGNTRLSREARMAEGLRLTRRGLEKRGVATPDQIVAFNIDTDLLIRLDRNRDGWVDALEFGSLLQQPGIAFGGRTPVAGPPPAATTPPATESLAADQLPLMPPPAKDPIHASPAPAAANMTGPALAGNTAPVQAPAAANGEEPASKPAPVAQQPASGTAAMPDAETILKHLDKNKNGQLDRSEAVDQLLANFDKLDRDRDDMLSDKEIKRGLFLAKMFGIKPKQDPKTYRSDAPSP